ncbi:type IV pilus twitching motility protein PilT [bacterium]|nr:type IV pilus twitching motility protein PilT [bacterium]
MDYTILDLLVQLVEHGASDLHLTAGVPPSLRVHGKLMRLDYKPLMPEDVRSLAFSMIREDQRKKYEIERELDFGYSQKGIGRFRCNLAFQRESTYMVMRAISEKIPTMEELLLPEIMKEVLMLPRGMVLVTGPTGSGKSTSLAAMLNVINESKDLHIVTMEDPIEYVHQHKRCNVNQREVGSDTISFASALKRVFRQDPDVILVGEMRDLETIGTAITAAETGHLVFATLHTNNAPLTIDRIVDVFPPGAQDQIRAQLANSLQCILSQQLLPLAEGGGRVATFEVMLNIPAIRNLIRERKEFQIHSVMMTHSKLGMMTMDQNLRDRYIDRYITLEVAMAHAGNVGNLQRLISASAVEGGHPGTAGVPGSRPGSDRGGGTLEGSSIGV